MLISFILYFTNLQMNASINFNINNNKLKNNYNYVSEVLSKYRYAISG